MKLNNKTAILDVFIGLLPTISALIAIFLFNNIFEIKFSHEDGLYVFISSIGILNYLWIYREVNEVQSSLQMKLDNIQDSLYKIQSFVEDINRHNPRIETIVTEDRHESP